MGLLRVLLVSIAILSLLAHVGALGEYFSNESVLNGRFAREAFPDRLSLFFLVESPWWIRVVFVLGFVAHLFWLVGLYTRPASVAVVILWASMMGRNPLLYSMPDQLQMTLIVLLFITPSGRGLSLDARLRHRGGRVPVWCRRLIQLQIAMVYLSTGLTKVGPTWWGEGSALYYTLVSPNNRHFDLTELWALLQPWVLRPLTWTVLAFELSFAGFAILNWIRETVRPRWLPDLRPGYLGFGIVMHLGIQAMLYVVWFTPLMLAAYVSFLNPGEVRALLARVRLSGWWPRAKQRGGARGGSARAPSAS